MDKYEEAMAIMARVRNYHSVTPSIVRALDLALAALREKQQREQQEAQR